MELLKEGNLNDPNLLLGKKFLIDELVGGKPKEVGLMKPAGVFYQDENGFLYTRGLTGDKSIGKYFASDRPDRDLRKEILPKK